MKMKMKMGLSLFYKNLQMQKMSKITLARIKLLRNKREMVVRQMRRDRHW
ncbi:hypothetical protein KY285_013804 [Solanum tuberosum]|nr:hypothetical protein KY285_013804 [Solanum tuberosum]